MNTEIDYRKYGMLAYQFQGAAYENEVLKSAAGYYIGTVHPVEGPNTRESYEYYRSEDDAKAALELHTWTQRMSL